MVTDKRKKTVLISALLFALIAHGICFFNVYAHNDNMGNMFDEPGIFLVGRWAITVSRDFLKFLVGYQVPLITAFNGFISIFMISIVVIMLIDIFDIYDKKLVFLFTGICICFPTVTSEFGYMFTAPYHFFGLLAGVFGCWILALSDRISQFKKHPWIKYLVSIFCFAFSIGIYQIHLSYLSAVVLLYCIKTIAEKSSNDNGFTLIQSLKMIGKVLAVISLSCVLYIVINYVYLILRHERMNSYHEHFMQGSFRGYIKGAFIAYREFFFPTLEYRSNMYPFNARYVYCFVILMTIFVIILWLYRIKIKRKSNLILVAILLFGIPLTTHMCYVAFNDASIHSLMTFAFSLVFIFPLFLIEKLEGKTRKIMESIATLSISYLILFFIFFSNCCYLKTELVQKQTISYFDSLISRIESTEGYKEGMPVSYINEREKIERNRGEFFFPIEILITPYEADSYINDYAWRKFMARWNGFDPPVVQWNNSEEIINDMGCYPEENSVKVYDGVCYVRFR